jgi:hypothetical protein
VFQIVERFVDLLERVPAHYQFVQLQLAFPVPPHEQRKVAIGSTVSAAGAGEASARNVKSSGMCHYNTLQLDGPVRINVKERQATASAKGRSAGGRKCRRGIPT